MEALNLEFLESRDVSSRRESFRKVLEEELSEALKVLYMGSAHPFFQAFKAIRGLDTIMGIPPLPGDFI